MFKNKPLTLIIASALLVVLIILTAVFQFAGGRGMDLRGGPGGNFQPGSLPADGSLPEGMQPPSGDFQPGADRPQGGDMQAPQGGFDGGDANGFQPGNFQGGNNTSMKLMQLLRGVQTGASILVMLLGVLAVTGILVGKPWGRTWAIITAILMILASLSGLFQPGFGFNMIGSILKMVLAAAVLVLCFLPKSRLASASETA